MCRSSWEGKGGKGPCRRGKSASCGRQSVERSSAARNSTRRKSDAVFVQRLMRRGGGGRGRRRVFVREKVGWGKSMLAEDLEVRK